MAARKIVTRDVLPESYRDRWRKAQERQKAMKLLLIGGMADAALVEAVQSVIAGADAFTIHHLGKQSTSDRHEDVITLVESVGTVRGSIEAARHLSRLIANKAGIEYGGRYPSPEDARRLCTHADRFVEFVERSFRPDA